jgi:hypothetical protein
MHIHAPMMQAVLKTRMEITSYYSKKLAFTSSGHESANGLYIYLTAVC